ncbi:MAG: hypothetical protein KDA79_07595 [Planctomycetaceae bacterium]|nr:hypothetical protein [Planctomycetaceae bacterium]
MPVPQRVPEFLFRLLIPLGALFVMTVLALVMLPFSESRAPLARLLDMHGGRLIAVEVAALAVVGLLALVTDRLSTLSQSKSTADDSRVGSPGTDSAEDARPPAATQTSNETV